MVGDANPLPSNLEDLRRKVRIETERPSSTSGIYAADAYDSLGCNNALNLNNFRDSLRIEVLESTADDLVFELAGVDPPIANALRRVLLSEVPSMAVETVMFHDNTSVMHDEILAHRLGLVPILADARQFEYRDEGQEIHETNCLLFKLSVECKVAPGVPSDAPPEKRYINSNVFSGDIKWEPIGNQSARFASHPIRPVLNDILLCKLRPGQRIEVEMQCVKGIGRTHAKWSPVATAFYRMVPEVSIVERIAGPGAVAMATKCPMNVFDIEDDELVVARPEACTMCRECIREGSDKDRIKLARLRDHFIFSIESTGVMSPKDIFVEAIQILEEKCRTYAQALVGTGNRADIDEGGE